MNKKKINLLYHGEDGQRLDVFLASELSISRNIISNNIKQDNVLLNNVSAKPSSKLKKGDLVTGYAEIEDNNIELIPETKELDIIFENDDVAIINKPAGMPVHPGAGNKSGTLVNYLLGYLPSIKSAVKNKGDDYESIRPGIIHRLDKDTSGIIVVAKNERALTSVSKQIKNRKVKKIYNAICYGWPKEDRGELKNFIGRSPKNRKLMAEVPEDKGKEAVSIYKALKYLTDSSGNKVSLIEFNIKTGRTHQIRVQSKIAGFPVLGDPFYYSQGSQKISKLNHIQRQMLHAKSIDFFLPGATSISHFEAPLPEDIQAALSSLDKTPAA